MFYSNFWINFPDASTTELHFLGIRIQYSYCRQANDILKVNYQTLLKMWNYFTPMCFDAL